MRFFIVDDSESMIMLIREQLVALGHEVEGETDSTRALADIRRSKPDCTILDIMMPGVDGLTLCKQLRELPELKAMKIIMVSAKPYEHDRNRARELGANGYVNKIAERDTLIDRILEIAESVHTLKFWGVRGTLPVPGPKTLKYGGNTNCVSLELPTRTLFVFDAGTGIKCLSDALLAEKRSPVTARIFISHPHWDHINALPFFAPLYVKGNRFEIMGSSHAGTSMQQLISAQMDGVYFPVTVQEFGADVRYRDLAEGVHEVDGVRVETLLLKHPGHCLGYRVDCGGQAVCYVSDNELYPKGTPYHDPPFRKRLIEFIQGARAVIADTTYTDAEYPAKMHWGHSPVSEVTAVAHEAGVDTLYLYHHDPDQDDAAIEAKLAAAQRHLATLKSSTRVEAPAEGYSVRL
ncbi:MAG TPA: response regulator [Candidatus Binatia bacterium]|nr:response regulator [Candidatus Binatia bacterium]